MSAPAEPWSSAAAWRGFFDLRSDAVVGHANTAALRLRPRVDRLALPTVA